MPGWNIHLEAGERLADKLDFSGRDRREFLLGCILPDINNGYLNKVKVVKEHSDTHYAYEEKSSLNFYKENKQEICRKNPIFLGYLLHLYTDGYFNYDFYRTIKYDKLGEGLSRGEKLKIKHNDFWIYDTNFSHYLNIESNEMDYFVERANKIDVAEIDAEDILDVERILKDGSLVDVVKGKKYCFYTKSRLDKLLDDMIRGFSEKYLEDKNA